MIDLSGGTLAVSAPPLAPVERPIDLEHLSRMTLGERSLECEVLQLFDRQSTMLLARMKNSPPSVVAALAHTLKGSARGIGAWPVASSAEQVEGAATLGDAAEVDRAVAHLSDKVAEAKSVIADLLRAH